MDADRAAPVAWRFDRFTLDASRGALLADGGAEIPLRPKSFALLRLLVENAGRLLDRDAIMTAVWADVVVTDESITQCVRDIRKAIGDDAQQVLRTVPKRGYLLAAEVTRAAPAITMRADPRPAGVDVPSSAPPAAELVESQSPAGRSAAERRQLTVMACDLVDSTVLSEQLDLEDYSEVIRAYQEHCTAAIVRFGGHVAKYMGDGVLAYFGYPHAHEDDAERSVRAGLAIAGRIDTLKPCPGVKLQVRVGIATGPVVTDLIEGAQGEVAIGKPQILATRLQALADPGAVAIAEGTRALIGELFALEDLGSHALKNVSAPVHVWRVTGENVVESRFEALRGEAPAPLVGRGTELALLLERWDRAKSGEGQLALLCGEPGIGKSRLALALRDRLEREPLTALCYQGSPFHTNSALHPVIEQLERMAGFGPGDRAVDKLAKLEALFGPAVTEVGATIPAVAAFLSVPTEGRYGASDHLTPQQRKARVFTAQLLLVESLAARRPLLMIVEDAYWLDPTTLELFEEVVERIQRLPVLLVVTFRPEFSPPWTGHSHVTTLSLNRLSGREAAAVAAQVAGGRALSPEVVDQILTKTDGVPLFVEELTRMALDSGLVSDVGGRWQVVSPLGALVIPTTLHDTLMARLDRLTIAKEVAQVGAVIGREFSYQLLAAVAPLREDELSRALAELGGAELVFRRGAPPDATYSFKHALVQDAAYQSLLKGRRQQLHARIGAVLEERFPAVVEAQPELLARHCAEASLVDKAIAYSHQAARQAIARCAMAEAIAQLHQGLGMLAGLPDGVARRRQELELQKTLGVPLIAIRGMAAPEVERAYLRARELCLQVGDAPQLSSVLFGLWWFYEVRADLRAAHELAEQLLELARQKDESAELIQAHRAMAHTLLWMGEFTPALAHFERAIALYDPQQHRSLAFTSGQEPGVLAKGFASHVLWYLGYPDRALTTMREALSQAREVGHPLSLAFALDHAAWLHQYRRETAETQERAEEDAGFSGERGFPFFLAQGTFLRGWALAEQGRDAEGMAQMRQGLAAHEATGAVTTRPYWFSLLARAYGRSGRAEDGLRVLGEASAMMGDQHVWEAELHRLRGELLLIRPGGGDDTGTSPTDAPAAQQADQPVTQAEVCFRHALDVARRQQAKSLELRAGTSLARLWKSQGKRAEARDLLAPIYGWFTEGFDTPDLQDARALLDELRFTVPGQINACTAYPVGSASARCVHGTR